MNSSKFVHNSFCLNHFMEPEQFLVIDLEVQRCRLVYVLLVKSDQNIKLKIQDAFQFDFISRLVCVVLTLVTRKVYTYLFIRYLACYLCTSSCQRFRAGSPLVLGRQAVQVVVSNTNRSKETLCWIIIAFICRVQILNKVFSLSFAELQSF